jgi:uncharacterized membrane protein YfcA
MTGTQTYATCWRQAATSTPLWSASYRRFEARHFRRYWRLGVGVIGCTCSPSLLVFAVPQKLPCIMITLFCAFTVFLMLFSAPHAAARLLQHIAAAMGCNRSWWRFGCRLPGTLCVMPSKVPIL